MNEVLNNIAEQWQPVIKKKSLDFRCEIAPGLPVLHLDAKGVVKAIEHLLSNALSFTTHGAVTLRGYVKNRDLFIEVEDTGIGIKKEDQQMLFTLFTQIHSSNLRYGSGMGLVIAKKIIEYHRGEIFYRSQFKKAQSL